MNFLHSRCTAFLNVFCLWLLLACHLCVGIYGISLLANFTFLCPFLHVECTLYIFLFPSAYLLVKPLHAWRVVCRIGARFRILVHMSRGFQWNQLWNPRYEVRMDRPSSTHYKLTCTNTLTCPYILSHTRIYILIIVSAMCIHIVLFAQNC